MSAPARISGIFLTISALWILASDRLVDALFHDQREMLSVVQTLKGWLFILGIALMLYLLFKREIDLRARTEAAITEREARFGKLFNSNPLPLWVYNRSTMKFLAVNEAACARYGYSRDEFLQMSVTELRPPEDVPRFLEFVNQGNHGDVFGIEWRHRAKSGEIIEVATSAHYLDFFGQPSVLVAIQDITERKRMEMERLENEQLRVRLSRETELRSIRNRFISMVSHEFRRPLTTITTSVELLELYRGKMTDKDIARHFSRIHEQIDEMKELLDDFLSLMRTEQAEHEFKPTSLDLTDLCAKLVELLRLTAGANHTIVYQTTCQSIQITGDEKLLRHAIGNLLGNAIKYSPQGGEVCLILDRMSDHIDLHVSDQGMGIPEADQAQIFSPFFRASNVHDINGSGLGLSIAKQAIELHGGTLEIARSSASGTEFLIQLPIDEGAILTGC